MFLELRKLGEAAHRESATTGILHRQQLKVQSSAH